MKVGDIVEAMHAKDLRIKIGLVTKELKPLTGRGLLKVYEVMTEEGVDTYTSGALRKIK